MQLSSFQLVPERSTARVVAQAPGHQFTAEGRGVEGHVRIENGQVVSLLAQFPLAVLDAGDVLGTRELRKFLSLEQRPIATVELIAPFNFGPDPSEAPHVHVGTGRFVFAIGSRKTEVSVDFATQQSSTYAAVSVRFSLSFKSLGYTPPKLLFLAVKDTLRIEISASLERADGLA